MEGFLFNRLILLKGCLGAGSVRRILFALDVRSVSAPRRGFKATAGLWRTCDD
jgi:hypothetical protein